MRIDVLTLFPEMFSALNESIMKRAQQKKLVELYVHNIRDYSTLPHNRCDDEPFGGGAGMVMMCEPIFKCIEKIKTDKTNFFFMSPRGKVFNQNVAFELSKMERIIILCGHYEGVDQRIIDYYKMQEISIGDYILTGGEIPAMAVIDAVTRLIDGVIKKESYENESFSNNMLEYNQYTRPSDFMGMKVPDVLLSGNHAEIEKYRLAESKNITAKNRLDLLYKDEK